MKPFNYLIFLSCALMALPVCADTLGDCLKLQLESADETDTVATLKHACQQDNPVVPARILNEKLTQDNAYVVTPHRQNYLLPFTYNDTPNQQPFQAQNSFPGVDAPIEPHEAKLQLSLKVPMYDEDLLFEHDGLYFGFTLKSFWQVYSKKISSPFRESNYRPEVFYQAPIPIHAYDSTFFMRLGVEHESNGRSQVLSRSWNRLYAGLGIHHNRWMLYLQPWYRLPEKTKKDDGDPNTPLPARGDDNPDIDDYFGHYEFWGIYHYQEYELSSMTRYNFASHKGAFELGITFPLWSRIRGYVQYFDGYGESLIDYDHRVQRLSVGFLLTDFL